MSDNIALLYRPNDLPEAPLVWFPLERSPEVSGLQGDAAAFHHWLAQQASPEGTGNINLYLFLADELVSFHQVDVPEGIKRNLNKLLPVLLEEQLAQDIDRVGVHYVAEQDSAERDDPELICNAAVWDQKALDALVSSLKHPAPEQDHGRPVRLKACLPVSAWDTLAGSDFISPKPDFWAQIPAMPAGDRVSLNLAESPLQQSQLLEQHRWNLVTPEQSEISPLYGVVALGLLALGLYLFNQWLSLL